MAISYVGSATGTTSATVPTHQVGDLIVVFAFRDGSTTAPSLPAGFTAVSNAGANTCSYRVGWKVAASTSETSGTWTNATSVVLHVYRGTHQTVPIGGTVISSGASTSVTYGTLTMTDVSGVSWVAGFAGHRSTNTTLENAPTGMTNRSTLSDATDEVAGHDTNGAVSSWTSTAVSVGGTSSGWYSAVLEIMEPSRAGQWSVSDKATNIALSNSNTTATKSGATTGSVRATTGRSTGKYFFSLTTASTTDVDYGVGVSNSTQTLTALFGGSNSIAYTSNGDVWYNNSIVGAIGSYQSAVTIIDVAVDLDSRLIWFRKDNGNWNNSGTADPTTGTGGFTFQTGTAYPAWQCTSSTGGNATVNLTGSFTYSPPSGYTAWDTTSASVNADVTGVSSTGSVGSATVIAAALVDTTGLGATGSVGSATASTVQAGAYSSAGVATGAATGESTWAGAYSSAGVATAQSTGTSTWAGTYSSSGAASATGEGRSIFAAVYSASGAATPTGVGASIYSGAYSSAGVGAASGTGRSTFSAIYDSSGTATAQSTGAATFSGVFASLGSATATGTGASTAASAYSSSGVATVSGSSAANSVQSGDYSSNGVATVSGVGRSTFSATGASSASATVSAASVTFGGGAFSGGGTSTVVGIGAAIGAGAYSSNGSSTATASSPTDGSVSYGTGGDEVVDLFIPARVATDDGEVAKRTG